MRADLRTPRALKKLRADYHLGTSKEKLCSDRHISGPTLYALLPLAGIKPGKRKTGPPRALSKQKVAEVARLYRRGLRGTQLAESAGVHSGTIYRMLELAGVRRRDAGEYSDMETAPEVRRKMKAMYARKANLSVETVARECGFGIKRARRQLKKVVSHFRGNHGGERNKRVPESERKQIVTAYRDGMPIGRIAKHYNTSTVTVGKIVRDADSPRRNPLIPQHVVNSTAFDKLTADAAYWIGMLMADGNLSKDTNRIKLTLHTQDALHLATLATFVGTDAPVQEHTALKDGKTIQAATLRFSDARIHQKLTKLGVTPNKSLTAKASQRLIGNRHFWRGVIDGDGHLHIPKSSAQGVIHIGLTGGSLELAKQFKAYAAQIVGPDAVNFTFRTKVKTHHHQNYDVIVRGHLGSGARTLAKHLYLSGGPALARKRALAMEFQTWKSRSERKRERPPAGSLS